MSGRLGTWTRTLLSGAVAALGITILWSSWSSGDYGVEEPANGPWTVPVIAGWQPVSASYAAGRHELEPRYEPRDDFSSNSIDTNLGPEVEPSPITTTIYVVKERDSLWRIAERELGSFRRIDEIEQWNPGIGKRMLQPGMELVLPRGGTVDLSDSPPPPSQKNTAPRQHRVRKGENLTGIAKKYRVTPEAIFAANRSILDSIDRVGVGQRLRIPTGGGGHR
jgi:LysM repeat protein